MGFGVVLGLTWEGLGEVLGGFWNPKIHDFRIFGFIFRRQISSHFLEGVKIRKKCEKPKVRQIFWPARRSERTSWEREKEIGANNWA